MKFFLFISFILISFLGTSQSKFAVGDRVEVRWKGNNNWYKGEIAEIKDSTYFIKYDDGDTEWTTAKFIKVEGEMDWPQNTCDNKETLFIEGDFVDVESKGKWYKGKVLITKEGQYYIHYEGYGSSYDEIVNNDRIRKWSGIEAYSGSSSSSSSSSDSGSSSSNSKVITLENVCDDYVVMYVDYERYRIYKGDRVEVTISGDKYIYTEVDGSKVQIGTASVTGSQSNFKSKCN